MSVEILQQLYPDEKDELVAVKANVLSLLLVERRTRQLQAELHKRTEDQKGRPKVLQACFHHQDRHD